MRDYLLGIVTGVALLLGALLLMAPTCHTEDSCAPQYSKVGQFGFWHAKEVTP